MAGGFNVVDFMDLPPVERCIVRLVLRETSMTYPELQDAIKTLPPDQQMDQDSFDTALDHLTINEWLVTQTNNQQISYRVNTIQKTANQSQGLLEGLDLEKNQPRPLRLNLDPADRPLANNRKRALPNHIWDCLTEPAAPATEPASEAPKRRTSLFDKFIDDDSNSKSS